MKSFKFHFNDLDAMLAEASKESENKEATSSKELSEFGELGSFDYAEALRFARQGWPAESAAVEAGRKLIALPPPSKSLVPSPVFSEEGDEVAVDRFLDGESDCFLAFPMAERKGPGRVVPVVCHVGGQGGVSTDSFARRGAAAIAIIDALESAGYRAEVWICSESTDSHNGKRFEFRCLIKRAEDALELDRLAFLISSPAVQRRFLFRFRELAGWNGYGGTNDIPTSRRPCGGDGVFIAAPNGYSDTAEARAAVVAAVAPYLDPLPA